MTWFEEWKEEVRYNLNYVLLAIAFLIAAIFVTQLAGIYADGKADVSVHDLILDNVGPYDLSFLFHYGLILVIAVLILYPLIYDPKKIHYAIGIFSLLLLVRAGFTMLTHLNQPFGAIAVSTSGPFNFLNYSADLFFSGHTAIPFLGFLLYDDKKLKYFFLFSSIVLGITVLVMHVHYSIDVLSAYFITYGVYKIGSKIFKDGDKNVKRKLVSKSV
ncbi:Uncharacterised protein [uncultured archaeon]|nr:Uncharacterised protein [uncultured archaeon]